MMYSENGLGETSGGYSTIYKQAYSIVYGREHKFFSQDFTSDGNYRIEKNTGGEKTIALPSEGLATYNGKAFTANHDGDVYKRQSTTIPYAPVSCFTVFWTASRRFEAVRISQLTR